jgi:RNA polymerase sigma factor for flagellar operon FliA
MQTMTHSVTAAATAKALVFRAYGTPAEPSLAKAAELPSDEPRITDPECEAFSVFDLDQRNRVIIRYLPLVKAIAVRILAGLPPRSIELSDLENAGVLGLIDGAKKYDPTKQVAFSAYVKHRIRGAILDSLRKLDSVSRDQRRLKKRMDTATRELTVDLMRAPTEAEIAAKLRMSLDQYRDLMVRLRYTGTVSASTRSGDDPDLIARELPAPRTAQPDSILARRQLGGLLSTALAKLPPRHRQVVTLYYTDDATMKEIGETLGVNESRVSQIHKSALARLAATLQASGINSVREVLAVERSEHV